MRNITITALALLVLGSASLFAEPEAEPEPLLGFEFEAEVPAEQAEALVKGLDEKPGWQARVDATFLRIDAEHADEVLGEYRPDEEGSPRAIPAELAKKLVAEARGQGAVRPEPLPPLVLYDGLTGRLSATCRHTYLQDYDVEVGQDDFTATPITGRLEDGARADVTPHHGDKHLRLDLECAWAELIRPIQRFGSPGPSVMPRLTLELPELRFFHVRGQIELPADGGFVLAGGGKAWDGETLRLVVLEVRRMVR